MIRIPLSLVDKVVVLRYRGNPELTVERRSDDTWAVCCMRNVYSKVEGWEWEPSPSGRSEDFLERSRYPFEEAMTLAESQIETVKATFDPKMAPLFTVCEPWR